MTGHPRRLRPGAAADVGDRLKLHRHVLRLGGRGYTVVTLRPGMTARFAVPPFARDCGARSAHSSRSPANRYHETWHVLSDVRGSRLLGRLCWGLSFQRWSHTIVVLDPRFLDPNPFDAAPSDPVVLANTHLGGFTAAAARDLRRRDWSRARPDGTVRWHTFGLAGALARDAANRDLPPGSERVWPLPPVGHERVERVEGVIVCSASPGHLRDWATAASVMGRYLYRGTNHYYLTGNCPRPHGELQIFDRYRRMVSVARQARREVLAAPDDLGRRLDEQIWDRCSAVWRRRQRQPSTVDN